MTELDAVDDPARGVRARGVATTIYAVAALFAGLALAPGGADLGALIASTSARELPAADPRRFALLAVVAGIAAGLALASAITRRISARRISAWAVACAGGLLAAVLVAGYRLSAGGIDALGVYGDHRGGLVACAVMFGMGVLAGGVIASVRGARALDAVVVPAALLTGLVVRPGVDPYGQFTIAVLAVGATVLATIAAALLDRPTDDQVVDGRVRNGRPWFGWAAGGLAVAALWAAQNRTDMRYRDSIGSLDANIADVRDAYAGITVYVALFLVAAVLMTAYVWRRYGRVAAGAIAGAAGLGATLPVWLSIAHERMPGAVLGVAFGAALGVFAGALAAGGTGWASALIANWPSSRTTPGRWFVATGSRFVPGAALLAAAVATYATSRRPSYDDGPAAKIAIGCAVLGCVAAITRYLVASATPVTPGTSSRPGAGARLIAAGLVTVLWAAGLACGPMVRPFGDPAAAITGITYTRYLYLLILFPIVVAAATTAVTGLGRSGWPGGVESAPDAPGARFGVTGGHVAD